MTESDDGLLDVEVDDELDLNEFATEELPAAEEIDPEQLGPLVEGAKSLLASVTDGEGDPAAGKLQALLDLVHLIQDVLTTTDTDELLDTVDFGDLDEVVDLDSLPEALESGELGDAVELTNLQQLIEFGQLWEAVDPSELMGSKDEISDTVGELTGDDDGEGGLFDGVEIADLAGGDEGEMGSLTDPELMQAATQAQLDSAVDGFRELLIETHARLDELRTANEVRFDGVDQPSSRNPTAVSTLPTHRGPPTDASRASTVPRNVRHSTGPSRRRIYGRRFDKLMNETQADDHEADEEPVGEEKTNDKAATEGGEDQ
ncbi:MAG: hypothetical protein R6V31_01425 [Halohasta sp.]